MGIVHVENYGNDKLVAKTHYPCTQWINAKQNAFIFDNCCGFEFYFVWFTFA